MAYRALPLLGAGRASRCLAAAATKGERIVVACTFSGRIVDDRARAAVAFTFAPGAPKGLRRASTAAFAA